jgi:hypothetical protein
MEKGKGVAIGKLANDVREGSLHFSGSPLRLKKVSSTKALERMIKEWKVIEAVKHSGDGARKR